MIENLSIRNFKVLRQVDLKLKPLTVIVGPNASGKSSILHALHYLVDLREIVREQGAPFSLVPFPEGQYKPFEALRSKESTGQTEIEGTGHSLSDTISITLAIRKGGLYSYSLKHGDRDLSAGLESVLGCTLLKFEVSKLGAPSYPKKLSLELPGDGEGLSSALAGIYLEDISRYRRLLEQLKSVIPSVQDIHIRQAAVETTRVGYQIFFDMKGGVSIPASNVSDGTLLTLGLLTVLSAPSPPHLVMIDDLERGFHPKALGSLVEQLRRVQEREPAVQIIATSHSPYLLDFLKAEEVLLTYLGEDGYATVMPLVDHPDYERWKDLMAPGEFWSSVGEDWITKDKKATAQ